MIITKEYRHFAKSVGVYELMRTLPSLCGHMWRILYMGDWVIFMSLSFSLKQGEEENILRCILQVEFQRPEEDADSWFHLLVLHQNRAKRGPTSYIPEGFLPSFFHLVIWGHEHDCRIQPEATEKV